MSKAILRPWEQLQMTFEQIRVIIEVSLCLLIGVPDADDFVSQSVVAAPGSDRHMKYVRTLESKAGVNRQCLT